MSMKYDENIAALRVESDRYAHQRFNAGDTVSATLSDGFAVAAITNLRVANELDRVATALERFVEHVTTLAVLAPSGFDSFAVDGNGEIEDLRP